MSAESTEFSTEIDGMPALAASATAVAVNALEESGS